MSNLIKINTDESTKVIQKAVKAFLNYEPAIEREVVTLKQVKEVTDTEGREAAYQAAKAANKTLKEYEDLRLETTRPLDNLKKEVMAYAQDFSLPLQQELNRVKASIQAFDTEQERKRQEELARIEAERKAREEAERKERERVEQARAELVSMESRLTNVIAETNSPEDMQRVINSLSDANVERFQEFAEDALAILHRMKESAQTKLTHLQEMERIRKEQEEARASQAEEAAKLAEIRARQAEEARKAQEEAERLERERIENERRKAELAAERSRLEEEARRQAEEVKRLKELEAARQKGIKDGYEIEVIDINQVPDRFVRKEINKTEINKALKEGVESIPGLKITTKTGLVLA